MNAFAYSGIAMRVVVALVEVASLTFIASMLGVLLDLPLGLSRVLLAMSRRGDMPRGLARLDGESVTPRRAVIAVGAVISGSFSDLHRARYSASPRAGFSGAGLASCLGLAFWVDCTPPSPPRRIKKEGKSMTHKEKQSCKADSRREFVRNVGAGSLLVLSGCASSSQNARPAQSPSGEGHVFGVSANEDLMREHGVLDRLLLVYDASRARLTEADDFDPRALHRAATLVRNFIEQYHEKLEEDHVFPRFERAGQHLDLVRLLEAQHEAGRQVTDLVLQQTTAAGVTTREPLIRGLEAYARMYRPHSAREDTVLFPALRKIASPTELAELGEQFEQIEHQRFGDGGFAAIVSEVAEIERALGIHDLSRFTPDAG